MISEGLVYMTRMFTGAHLLSTKEAKGTFGWGSSFKCRVAGFVLEARLVLVMHDHIVSPYNISSSREK